MNINYPYKCVHNASKYDSKTNKITTDNEIT